MNRIVKQFEKAFRVAKERNFDKIYVGVDIHETCLKPTWSTTLSTEFYEHAKEALQLISNHPNVIMILWSCSLTEHNDKYHNFFKDHGIKFHYINQNPECKSTEFADFESKLYFNVGLDDKFGFDPDEDWKHLIEYFKILN